MLLMNWLLNLILYYPFVDFKIFGDYLITFGQGTYVAILVFFCMFS